MLSIPKHYLPHYKAIIVLSLPVVISQIGQFTVGLADSIMIGRYGDIVSSVGSGGAVGVELAASSFANTLFAFLMFFAMGFSFAVTPLIGEDYSKGDIYPVARWIKCSYVVNRFMGVILTFIGVILYLLMPYMGQPDEILDMAQSYFFIQLFTIIPLLLFFTGKQSCEGLHNTQVGMVVTLIGNLINVIVNYLFIFGKFGMPEMGLMGAGLGTLMSRLFMAAAIVWVFYKRPIFKEISELFPSIKLEQSEISRMRKMGSLLGFQFVSEASAFNVATIMMGWFGTVKLAAHQIVLSISGIGYLIYQGVGVCNTIRISNFWGQRDRVELRRASDASVHITTLLVISISALLYFTRDISPRMFTDDPDIIAMSSKFIVMLVVFQLFDAYQIIFQCSLRGMSDVTAPSLLTFCCYFFIAIPISYLAAFEWGVGAVGIWIGFPVGLGLCAALFIFRFYRKLKQL